MKRQMAIAAFVVLAASSAVAAEPTFVSDKVISVCTSAGFPPFTFKNGPEDTVPVGIDIEIADALAAKWQATTTYTTTEFAGLLPTLGSGRCELIISGIYLNDERRKQYDGASYMKSSAVIVTQADNQEVTEPASLSGRSVALEAGAFYKEERINPLNKELAAGGKPEVMVQDYPTQQAAYQQVLVGRVDATVTEEAEGAYRVVRSDEKLKIAYTWKSDYQYGIYMRRNPTDLAAVRSTLSQLREEGFFDSLAEKYGLDPKVFDVDYDY